MRNEKFEFVFKMSTIVAVASVSIVLINSITNDSKVREMNKFKHLPLCTEAYIAWN